MIETIVETFTYRMSQLASLHLIFTSRLSIHKFHSQLSVGLHKIRSQSLVGRSMNPFIPLEQMRAVRSVSFGSSIQVQLT